MRAPLKNWALRLSPESRGFLDDMSAREGLPRSTLAQRYIDEARILRTELGAEWWEVVRLAHEQSEPIGAVLAHLIHAALERSRKK